MTYRSRIPDARRPLRVPPSFAWTPVAGADKYEFQISADIGMNSPVLGRGYDDFFGKRLAGARARIWGASLRAVTR